MTETSRRPAEHRPESVLPEEQEEKRGEVLPIRPDIAVPASERSGLSEAEAKKTMDRIKEINRAIFTLRRDKDAVDEGLDEDAAEAAKGILTDNILSRIGRFFRRTQDAPRRYDEKTRDEVTETAVDLGIEVERLRAERRELAGKLDAATRERLEQDWRELDRIYDDLAREERGE